jgi:aquaporin Z
VSKALFAEGFGTFVLVLMGCGSAVLAGSKIGFLGISIAFGLAIVAMAYSVGGISGGHFNPAVSLAMMLKGRITKTKFLSYIVAQLAGSVIASVVLMVIASGNATYSVVANGLGQNGYGALSPLKYNLASCFLFEIVFTTVFVLVIFGVAGKSKFDGLVIGLTLAMIHIVGIPITGVSVNPARSIGPALFAGSEAISQLWLFIAAPLMGAVIAFALSNLVDEDIKEPISVSTFSEELTGEDFQTTL